MNKSIALILGAMLTLGVSGCGDTKGSPAVNWPPAGPTLQAPTFTPETDCPPRHQPCAR
jgi:hypothetical protein